MLSRYMEEYEEVMKLNVVRPVTVTGVTRTTMGTFLVDTDCLLGGSSARWEARAVISGEIRDRCTKAIFSGDVLGDACNLGTVSSTLRVKHSCSESA